MEINPEHASAYYSRGNSFDEKGRFGRAIADYNQALRINPNYAEAYYNRGVVYSVRLEDISKACSDFKRACQLGLCDNYNMLKQSGDCR